MSTKCIYCDEPTNDLHAVCEKMKCRFKLKIAEIQYERQGRLEKKEEEG